jgi:hypothetical protein
MMHSNGLMPKFDNYHVTVDSALSAVLRVPCRTQLTPLEMTRHNYDTSDYPRCNTKNIKQNITLKKKFSMFECLKVTSSFLWSMFIVEVVLFYVYPTIVSQCQYFYSLVLATWALIVVVVLEEIYYMIEEKVIKNV